MDASQSNENELQKAIDDITSGATAPETAGGDVATELEAKIQNQMGTPPMPPMPDMPGNSVEAMNPMMPPEVPAAEATDSPAIVGSGSPVAINDAPSETQDVPVTVGATSAAEAPASETDGDLGSVKQAMLRDLFPLMDKVNMGPEQKYDIYKEMIETTGDKSMIPAAYEAVKSIADETAKAEALLYLVDKAE